MWCLAAAGILSVAVARAEGVGDRGHDSSLPIAITSDTLEVQRENQVAIFRGNVDAVQGEMNLRADTLVVRYETGGEGNQEISRIEAEGNVFVSSPSETASGDEGVYNVVDGVVELVGSIVLTRGDNVIRGDRVELNLTTGESRVSSDGPVGGSGRVKGLFVPKQSE